MQYLRYKDENTYYVYNQKFYADFGATGHMTNDVGYVNLFQSL